MFIKIPLLPALYQNTFGSETSDAVNLSGLVQGYYYIKITQYNSNDFEAYSLADSFTQVNIAKISLSKSGMLNTCSTDSLVYSLSASHSPYTVRLYKDGSLFDSTVTTASTITFTGLNDGNYYATVYGDGATDSAYGKSVTTALLPLAPSLLPTTNIGVHTATLNWSSFTCVKNYRIQYKVTGH